jgi:hypothetical protein
LPPEARARVAEVPLLIVEKLLLTPTEQLQALGDGETINVSPEALTRLFGIAQQAPGEEAPPDGDHLRAESANVEPLRLASGPAPPERAAAPGAATAKKPFPL